MITHVDETHCDTHVCPEMVKSGQTPSPQVAATSLQKTLPSSSFEVMTDI